MYLYMKFFCCRYRKMGWMLIGCRAGVLMSMFGYTVVHTGGVLFVQVG